MTHPTSAPSYRKPKKTRFFPNIEERRAAYVAECAALGIEYGTCFCTCGTVTGIAKKSERRLGHVRGLPYRYINGHSGRDHVVLREAWKNENVPYGYCGCGCGEKTPIAKGTNSKAGHVAGQPTRFIKGHHHCIKGVLIRDLRPPKKVKGPRWIEQDCGYGTHCWVWQWAKHVAGYGIVNCGGRTQPAHRIVYESIKGPIPKGLYIDHLCRNPPCVNPDHLEPVTNAENVRRGLRTSLKEADIERIFALRRAGMKWRAIATTVGTSYENARDIGCGKRWGDVRARILREQNRVD